MVKVVIGTKVCSFEELAEEYNRVCEENRELEVRLKDYADIIDRQQNQISKLEKENEVLKRVNQVLIDKEMENSKIFEIDEKEPLPFSDEQYKEETKVELPTMPIDVASMLINATVEYPTPSICKVFGAGDTSFATKYSKSDLREIAEHLFVYCNNSDDDEDDTQS